MATQTDTTTGPPRIVGSIMKSGRFYVAGEEVQFAKAMQGRTLDHLADAGHITGDWSTITDAPASPPPESPASEPAEETEDLDTDEPLPTLADLPDHLADIESVDDVKALQSTDTRKGAQPMYAARLAQLNGEE